MMTIPALCELALGGVSAFGLIGEIKLFSGATAPSNWHVCDGSAVSRATFSALFSAIGTTYGSGDGSTTFNLPDARGRALVGIGTGYALGSMGGAESVTLSASQLPVHNHTATTNISIDTTNNAVPPATTTFAEGSVLTSSSISGTTSAAIYLPSGTAQTHPGVLGGVTTTVNNSTGGGSAVSVMQPYLTVNYIIRII